jgi:integrase
MEDNMNLFRFSKACTIADYANGLYDLDGYLMRKRRQKSRPLTDKSAEIRNNMIKNYVIPLWGDICLSKLTVKKIDDELVNLLSVREGKELSGLTKNTILTILDDIFVLAIEDGVVDYNPVRSVMRFSREITDIRGAIPKREMEMLFPVSHEALVKIWRKQIYATAYLVLRDTGLRPGELRALQWGDWYPDLRFFPVTKAIESGKRDKIKGTKTGSVKPAVVTEQTAAELELLRAAVEDYSPDKFIFSDRGGPFTIVRLDYNFRMGILRAGLDRPYSPYWLRHTFNTRMLDVLPDDTVRLLMGHATEAMTRHYRHPDIESLKKEAEKIKDVLNKVNY